MMAAPRQVAREQLRMYGAGAMTQTTEEHKRREWLADLNSTAGWG